MKGTATFEGTRRYAARFEAIAAEDHFREAGDLMISSLGMGSYLGDHDQETDEAYLAATKAAVKGGINFLDTASNYRAQRSERVFGRALAELFSEGFQRDELVVCSKVGFLHHDGAIEQEPKAFIQERYLDSGLIGPGEIVQGCHSMSPAFLEAQLDQSLANLGLETIDIYYLHNPEIQLEELTRPEFLERFKAAAAWFEEKVAQGKIRAWGLATWSGFRVAADARVHLSLGELMDQVGEVVEEYHNLGFIQLPFGLGALEAWTMDNQLLDEEEMPLLVAAEEYGISLIASAPLLQGSILPRITPRFIEHFPGLTSAAQCCLQFNRSIPGLVSTLVGMKTMTNVQENLVLVGIAPLPEEQLHGLFTS